MIRGDSGDAKLTPNPDEDYDYDWDLADVPVHSQVHDCANLRQDYDAIREQSRSANVAVPEDASSVFSLTLEKLNAIK